MIFKHCPFFPVEVEMCNLDLPLRCVLYIKLHTKGSGEV